MTQESRSMKSVFAIPAAVLLLLPLQGAHAHSLAGESAHGHAEGFLSGLAHPLTGLDHLSLSLALWGLLLAFPTRLAPFAAAGLAGLAGVVHATVYGGISTVSGWASLAPYLLGLAGMQWILALLIGYAETKIRVSSGSHAPDLRRLAGLGAAGLGLALFLFGALPPLV